MGRKGDGSMIQSVSYPIALGTEINKETGNTFMQDLELLAKKEGKSLSKLTVELWKDYWKKHGNGNPGYMITQWAEDANLKALPAFGNDSSMWKEYIENLKDDEELKELMAKSAKILDLTNKKHRYGTTNVKVF